MKREEAITYVKDLCNKLWSKKEQEALETLIPELKESEDERIRKAIVYAIGQSTHSDGTLINGVSSEEALAWLEKQKEQKPVEQITKDNEIISNPEYNPNYHDELSQCKDVLFNIATILSKYEDKEGGPLEQIRSVIVDSVAHGVCLEEGKKEQKPTEKQDYAGLTDLEKAIHRGFLSAGEENVPVTIIKETAKECLAQMKPAEWSEEDENTLNNIISLIEEIKSQSLKRLENWDGYIHFLKSLRPQPKQEWSVKDELTFTNSVETLEYLGKFELANWLKEHKNQFLKPQNTWKPSEEQLSQLQFALNLLEEKCDNVPEDLWELYEQLKDLM